MASKPNHLTMYRRHAAECGAKDDPTMTKCKCPLWVHGRIHGGKPGRWALGTREIGAAEQRRDAMIALAPNGSPLQPPPAPAPKKTEITEAPGSDRVVREFLLSRRARCTKGTVASYSYSLESFGEFVRRNFGGDLSRVTEDDVLAWAAGDGNYTARTRATRRIHVATLCRWAVKRKLLAESPITEKHQAPQEHARQPFTEAEIDSMIDVLPRVSANARAQFLVMLYSGMRISDCVFLRRRSVNFETGMLSYRPIKSKSKKYIVIKLNAEALNALRKAEGGGRDFFFLPEADYSRAFRAIEEHGDFLAALPFDPQACTQAARKAFKGICSRAMIPGSGRTPHRLRSTFAVSLLRANVDIFRVSELLGHSSVQVTERAYTAILKEHRQEIAHATSVLQFGRNRMIHRVA